MAKKKAAAKTATTKKATPKKKATAKPAQKKRIPANPKPAKTGTPKVSALGAAAVVLKSAKEPMNCKELIAAMAAKKLWTSPGGKTPHATLYSAIIREIATKGKDSRFKKADKGKFAFAG